MAWEGSTRKAELPRDWPQRRAAIIARDGTCRWPTDRGPCGAHGTDVDHKGDKSDHSLGNLWLLCSWHHARKTAQQGNAARTRFSRRRKPESHPGLL